MSKAGKLGLTVLLLMFAILSGSARPVYACPYQHFQCPEPWIDCCCDRGVICANNWQECENFCQ